MLIIVYAVKFGGDFLYGDDKYTHLFYFSEIDSNLNVSGQTALT